MSCCPVPPNNCAKPRPVACFRKHENNTVLIDALGPYPDEVIMTVLDRLLYYSGATKIFHQLELAAIGYAMGKAAPPAAPLAAPSAAPPAALCAKPSCTSSDSESDKCSSHSSMSKYDSARSGVKCKPPNVCCPSPKTSSRKSHIAQCGSPVYCPRPRTPRVDFAHPVCDVRQAAGGPTISDRMKLSMSACSIACRRLKSKLSCNFHEHGQKWLWTRLVRVEEDCHVYEVYKNSNVDKAPNKMAGSKEPVILFLVMPNGHVMPFEALSTY